MTRPGYGLQATGYGYATRTGARSAVCEVWLRRGYRHDDR
jgi:hypothetical protein